MRLAIDSGRNWYKINYRGEDERKNNEGRKIMVNVAIVEDEIRSADVLCGFLERYGSEKGREFAVSRFTDAIAFLEITCRVTTSCSWTSNCPIWTV